MARVTKSFTIDSFPFLKRLNLSVLPGNMIDDRRKASWSVESDGVSCFVVSLQDAL